MAYVRIYLSVFVVVMAAMTSVINGDCLSDIQTCNAASSVPTNPRNLTALSPDAVNAVCTDTTGINMNAAITQGQCVYAKVQSPACSSQFRDPNTQPVDWDRIKNAYNYICANKDAYLRAAKCISPYSTQYSQCMNTTTQLLSAAVDLSKLSADQQVQAYCTLQQGVQQACLLSSTLLNCPAADMNVVKTATSMTWPPACGTCGLKSFSIFFMIVFALTMSII